jgi:uracil-DNA glycosylase
VIKAESVGGLPRLGDLLVEDSWRQLLAPELAKPSWADLEAFVHSEWAGSQMVFPPKHAIFRWGSKNCFRGAASHA